MQIELRPAWLVQDTIWEEEIFADCSGIGDVTIYRVEPRDSMIRVFRMRFLGVTATQAKACATSVHHFFDHFGYVGGDGRRGG